MIEERTRLAADAGPTQRILYVANGAEVPSLLLSFVEPLKAIGNIQTAFLTEGDLKSPVQDAAEWRNSPDVLENLRKRLDEFHPTLIVFCRYSGPCCREIVEWARAAQTPTIYHIDDYLLHVPDEVGKEKARSHNQPRRVDTVRYLLDETTLAYCSTEKLRRRIFGDAPNTRAVAGEIYCASEILAAPTTDEPPVIGYMGFGSHDYDFTFALPALVRILDARPDVRFEIFGTIALPAELERFGDRVRRIEPIRDYGLFLQKLATLRWTIGICPLARTPFNEVKSNTKWVEYSACGFAVIATRGLIYDGCCSDGCGLLAEGDDEWFAAFDKLLSDKTFHRAQVERAQRRVQEEYSRDRLRRQIFSVFERARELEDQPAVTKLVLDEFDGEKFWGWAWTSAELPGGKEKLAVELWCGDVLLGRLGRRQNRPDVDKHLRASAWPKGFAAPAGCLNALCRLMGGEESGFHPTLRFSSERASLYTHSPLWRDLAAHRTLRSAETPRGWRVADLWWANSHLLKARATYHPISDGRPETKMLRVFQPARQSDGSMTLAIADEAPIQERQAVYSFGLRNPLMPILLMGYDEVGEISLADLIPFPSLLRGGLHEAETAALGDSGGLDDFCRLSDAYLAEAAGWGNDALSPAVGEIAVNLETATGAEPIFDSMIREWLAVVFRVPLVGANAERRIAADLGDSAFVNHAETLFGRDAPVPAREGRLRLSLPCCAIPTVGALASIRLPAFAATTAAPFIAVDESQPHHRYVVTFPASLPKGPLMGAGAERNDFPVLSALTESPGAEETHSQPVAILIRDLAPRSRESTLYPVPKDTPSIVSPPQGPAPDKISIFVRLSEAALDIRLLLGSIAAQKTASALELVLVGTPAAASRIEEYRQIAGEALTFPARIVEGAAGWSAAEALNQAGAIATGDAFIVIDPRTTPYDQRTFDTLARLACVDGVGTVGCMQLRPRNATDGTPVFRSAGYFPGRIDFAAAPHLALSEPDCSALLADSIYPVAANSAHMFALSATAWRQAGGMNPHFPNDGMEIDLALRLASSGLVNICTTLLSVFTEADNGPKNLRDKAATSHLNLWRLLPALESSTIVRSF